MVWLDRSVRHSIGCSIQIGVRALAGAETETGLYSAAL